MATDIGLLNPSAIRVWPQQYGQHQPQRAEKKEDGNAAAVNVIEVQARRVDFEDSAVRVGLATTRPAVAGTESTGVSGAIGGKPVAGETGPVAQPFMYEPSGTAGNVQLRTAPRKRGLIVDVLA